MENDKKGLRQKFSQVRKNVANRLQKDKVITDIFKNSDLYKKANSVMFYVSMEQEVDTKRMIATALADGKRVFVPKVTGKGEMCVCEISDAQSFERSNFGVYEPVNPVVVDKDAVELIVVPGMAFDKSGTRLGYGGGFYDRFLSDVKCDTVGFCYEVCLTDKLIKEITDIGVEYIITEKGLISCGG
ncbi:MAG: 5-formyltetrahydrofolate cyclo-ligase [Eubacteriales bacterium]|nr:5-formyltetrahydrofolate cyclo-ligase [Eubacteriales bacterium]